jgi:hypothetical protein
MARQVLPIVLQLMIDVQGAMDLSGDHSLSEFSQFCRRFQMGFKTMLETKKAQMSRYQLAMKKTALPYIQISQENLGMCFARLQHEGRN